MRPVTRHLTSVSLALAFAVVAGIAGAAEGNRPLAAVVDEYVSEGLRSNLSLRAQSLEVESAAAALDGARARYFPEAGFAARYSRSEGGRTIELPLGDALNPAYQTLNDLLVAQGQSPQFPVVQNESIAFLREREQDTRITLRMPLIAPAIPAAVRAQRALLDASEYGREALGRSPTHPLRAALHAHRRTRQSQIHGAARYRPLGPDEIGGWADGAARAKFGRFTAHGAVNRARNEQRLVPTEPAAR
jgi:hypothetical protein